MLSTYMKAKNNNNSNNDNNDNIISTFQSSWWHFQLQQEQEHWEYFTLLILITFSATPPPPSTTTTTTTTTPTTTTITTTLRVPSSLLDDILIRCQGNDSLPSKLDCLALEKCFHFRQNGFDHTIGSDCHSQWITNFQNAYVTDWPFSNAAFIGFFVSTFRILSWGKVYITFNSTWKLIWHDINTWMYSVLTAPGQRETIATPLKRKYNKKDKKKRQMTLPTNISIPPKKETNKIFSSKTRKGNSPILQLKSTISCHSVAPGFSWNSQHLHAVYYIYT